jgi:hypothetical protein
LKGLILNLAVPAQRVGDGKKACGGSDRNLEAGGPAVQIVGQLRSGIEYSKLLYRSDNCVCVSTATKREMDQTGGKCVERKLRQNGVRLRPVAVLDWTAPRISQREKSRRKIKK